MEDVEQQLFQKCFEKVNTFFKDEAKSRIWMDTVNPLLGNISPIEMIMLGRHEKLFQFIDNQLMENKQ